MKKYKLKTHASHLPSRPNPELVEGEVEGSLLTGRVVAFDRDPSTSSG
jgi:hypothetical protein